MTIQILDGRPYPLGATWDGKGANFALFSAFAERVVLCIFDSRGRRELARIPLPQYTDQVWHGYLPDARPGLLYGYRVYGPYQPARGHRFNEHKLLLDPYAKSLVGPLRWSDAHFAYRIGRASADLSFDRRDDASGMPKCALVDTAFTWGGDRPPDVPWNKTVIYEMHVRGYTMQHPDIPPALRGTFAGLATAPVVKHLKELGVTTVELLPVHAFVDDRGLVEKRLRNYWGYNSIGFFAPEPRYLASGINDFKTMVKLFHDEGLEVVLDVVYNHTAEGNHFGPTLSFRGIDNHTYYRLAPGNERYYDDATGTGNTLDLRHPRVLQLVLDSLRYWVEEMHVDGFRFDLAPALARTSNGFDRNSPFFQAVLQDPVLARVKLMAEPWDVGMGGYQVGNFPPRWSEWNGKYRDTVRRFWSGHDGVVPELASRIAGSSDLYDHEGRRPSTSINFVPVHDGFTLTDLVSYNTKHNEANQENNNDGANDNESWNCGLEGPTEDPAVTELRDRQKRNMIATLLLSQGVPMILAGDEFGKSQHGNNNVYCQDNPLSWLDWTAPQPHDRTFAAFVRDCIALRASNAALQRTRFFTGAPIAGSDRPDMMWLTVEGRPMEAGDWLQNGRTIAALFGESTVFLFMANASDYEISFALPDPHRYGWHVRIDTARSAEVVPANGLHTDPRYPVAARSLALFSGTDAT